MGSDEVTAGDAQHGVLDSSTRGAQVKGTVSQGAASLSESCLVAWQLELLLTWSSVEVGSSNPSPLKGSGGLVTEMSIVNKIAKKAKVSCQESGESRPGITTARLQDIGYWKSTHVISQKDLLLVILRSHHIRFLSLSLHVFTFTLPPAASLSSRFTIKTWLYFAEKGYYI